MARVKPSKPALSRRDRGVRTRTRILEEARRLFLEQGFGATTVQQVADSAGVAVQTVYFNFRTKSRLLAGVGDTLILGDRPPDQWREHPWGIRILRSSDPGDVVRAFVEGDAEIKSRLAAFLQALGTYELDPESVVAQDRGRDEFFGSVIDRLTSMGALRPGLSPTRALDIIRVVNTLEAYRDLTERRGWTDAMWKSWLTEVLAHQLLGSASDATSGSHLDKG